MIPKPLDQIEKADIDALVTNQVKEGRTIEYKQVLPTNADKEKKEFLADVSSFANASGGDLLYGVVEKRDADGKTTGLPESVPGLAGVNADQEIRRLDSMVQAGIGPRIAGVRIRHIDGFPDGLVLLLRVPKSYSAPHMVTFQEHSRFYSRNNGGKYALDVTEIRSAFALSESLPERVRRFRDERVARIVASETPLPLPTGHARFVLHVLPVSSLDPTSRVDITPMSHSFHRLRPLGTTLGFDGRHNLDGFVTYVTFNQSEEGFCYAQLFRGGAIEAVEGGMTTLTSEKGFLRFGYYEKLLIEALGGYLNLQQELGIQPPVFVLLTIIGVKGFRLTSARDHLWQYHRIDRDVLLLPDILAEDFAQPAATILRPAFDAVWQSAGWPGSPSYDKEGRWTERG